MRAHSELLGAWQASLQSRGVSCGFSVQNQFIKDISGETKGEKRWKLRVIILENFIFLSGCLAAIHGVALGVQTQCVRLPWWGCLGARFSDTLIPKPFLQTGPKFYQIWLPH